MAYNIFWNSMLCHKPLAADLSINPSNSPLASGHADSIAEAYAIHFNTCPVTSFSWTTQTSLS